MKLDVRNVDRFLLDPGATRVILLHGDDVGLIRDRAGRLVRAAIGGIDDPFRLVELEREGYGRIADEMASLSMTGGRRVVRVREAGETVTTHVQTVLAGTAPGLLVLEGIGLTNRGKLRALVERASDAVSIACYAVTGRALEQQITAALSERGVAIDPDALQFLASQLGADQAVTLSEIEKLGLYAGAGSRVDLSMARICVGDLSGLSLDDALYAATSGDVAGTDRALELAMAEGAAPVGVLRAALMHLQRLSRARNAVDGGQSVAEAAKAVRPPLFFRREQSFIAALGAWTGAGLQQACQRVWEAERGCKRTGSPAETICRNALIGLAQRGAATRRRR